LISEGKVEGLSGEISDDIGQITSPEGLEALLFGDSGEDIDDASVLFSILHFADGCLVLEE